MSNEARYKPAMNWSKFFIAFIVAFVFVFFFGFVWHGILMKPTYMEIASHYRAHDDMQWGPLLLGHVVMAFFFTWAYARFASGGPGAGMRLGVIVGLIFVGLYFIRFAVEPLTTKIVLLGSIGDVLEFALMGAIVGAIYKPGIGTA
jgi:hypothetical protein